MHELDQPETGLHPEQEGLTPRDIEEKACRCNVCGSGLSMVENLVHGEAVF